MANILRRLRRSSKKAAKFRFTVTLQELQLYTDEKWKPENLVVSFVHRRRKVSSKERRWEQSYSDVNKCVIMWPEQMTENVDILTTLYRTPDDDTFEDKEWTIVIEELTAKGKRKAIAAVPINVRLFILDLPEHKSELKLKLRPLSPHLKMCSLIILLGSTLISEVSGDDVSVSSSAAASFVEKVPVPEDEVDASVRDPRTAAAIQQIDSTATKIKEWANEKKEASPAVPAHRKPSEESGELAKIRPQWRVSAEEEKSSQQASAPTPTAPAAPIATNRHSRSSRASTEEKTATTTEFRVDSYSRPVPVATPISATPSYLQSGSMHRGRSNSPRAPSRDAVPQPVSGETLLSWCQRVTNGYSHVKINDFTKSWKNGLGLCAILHTYHPELIGDYESLDISNNMSGQKENVQKALDAMSMMGLTDIPTVDMFITPDRKQIELLLQRLRRVFEGCEDGSTPASASDHRISRTFGMTETEEKVVAMIAELRNKKDLEDAVDYTNIPDQVEAPVTPQLASRNPALNQPIDDDDDDAETSNMRFERSNVSITMVTPGVGTIRASNRASPSKRDELRQRAREMLEKSTTNQSATPNSRKGSDEERRREEVRRLLNEKQSTAIPSTSSSPYPTFRRINGSNTDLRRIDDPNDTPHVPAIGRRTNGNRVNCLSNVYQDKTSNFQSHRHISFSSLFFFLFSITIVFILYMLCSSSRVVLTLQNDPATPSTFDRVKRYGSMRSAELKESLQLMAKQYGYMGNDYELSSQDAPATPSKKFSSQWEKDVDDVEGTAQELVRIDERISDITRQAESIQDKIRETEVGSSEEEMLTASYLQLTNERNTLVHRQEYYNIIETIRPTIAEIEDLTRQIDEITQIADDFPRSDENKRATDKLMEEYSNAMKTKSNLVRKLFATEEEIEEDSDRLKNLTLDRATRFVRGIDQPVSASKRLIQWWRR
ncbi:Protein CBR-EHBP-1 [Caenorhabditis briggsae]|uniref:Protein CBR-EHBP-1 n=1 Tax=Caenorhabditis briggsae TaxID=6238 RepID=A8XVB6_CAEBR|nr:Protein CBR-EHBP-1 [Caenorhabditis briggsae]CAP36583.1 Protein CBR-EHBP-1 [Caenorhabditis briggsae]